MKSTKFSIIVLIIILITSFTSGQNFWEQTSAPGYIITYAMFQDENEYIYASAQNIGIYRSTNNGTNWSLLTVGLTNLNISCIRGDFDGTLYLGTKWPGILFKSTNNAQTWSQVTTTPTDIVSVLAIKGTQNIFVGTAEGIYRSLDKGTSWQLLDNGIPTSFPTIIHNIVILHNGDILASVSTDTFSRVYRSTDNGDSWAPTTSDTYYITRIKVDECNNYIYMSFNGGELWRSVDDGYSWEVKNNGIITNITSDIAINSSNYVYLATQGQDFEEVYRTTDLGNNWEAISSGLPYVQVISLLLTKDGFIYAGTYRNNTGYGIYRSVTPTFTPPLVTTNDPVNVTQTTATLKGP
ncbi:MAG: hypothetical protein IPH11_19285 [Ignavibacteriales bacterium]|nr:hypothetical protein [Ignavibacteriales bacterium]